MTMQDDPAMPGQHSVYIPVLIGLAALVGLLAFQAVELSQVHGALIAQRDGQNAAIEASDKMRQQLVTIASKTAELAQKGDPDAKALVDAYAKRGLQFAPPKAPAAGTPAPKS
jgi:NAD/NADP transhydrogenase alpha subunit